MLNALHISLAVHSTQRKRQVIFGTRVNPVRVIQIKKKMRLEYKKYGYYISVLERYKYTYQLQGKAEFKGS